MPNLRRLPALIGLASAVAAIAAKHPFGPDPELQLPSVSAIVITPDTVWFCAESYPGATRTTFGFARASREWIRAGAERPACVNAPRIESFRDTVALGGRMSAIAMRPPRDSNDIPQGRAFLRINDSVSGKQFQLKPPIDQRLRRLIQEGYEIGTDTVAVEIQSAFVTDTIAWIGLAGGFAEGMGDLGGIYRLDRRTGAWELITDSTLAERTVAGLAPVGEWLWVGTQNPAEYGAYGDVGLLRFNTRTRSWKSYTDSTSPLPDALVRTMASQGNLLAVATERGLAVIELGAGTPGSGDEAIARWNTRYFVPGFAGDSLVFTLGDSAQAPLSRAQQAPFLFLQLYSPVGQERLMYEAVKRVPLASLEQAAWDAPESAGNLLADTSLVPLFMTMLSGNRDGQILAATAIGRLGSAAPETAVDALRRAFLAMDTVSEPAVRSRARTFTGIALVRLGDSTSTRWARNALDQLVRTRNTGSGGPAVRPDWVIAAAAEIVAYSRDPASLSLLMSVMPLASSISRPAILNAFATYDTPQAWGAAISFARSNQLPKADLLHRFTPGALRDPVVAARVRDMIRETVSAPQELDRMSAMAAIRRLRLMEFAPALVSQLSDTSATPYAADGAVQTLISLTGQVNAPTYSRHVTAETVEWWRRWLVANPNAVAVPEDQGQKALMEWTRRRYPPG